MTSDESEELQLIRQSAGLLVGVGDEAVVSQSTRQSVELLVDEGADWGPVLIEELALTIFNDGATPAILYKSALFIFTGFKRLGVVVTLTLRAVLVLRGAMVEAMIGIATGAVLRKGSMLEVEVTFGGALEAAIIP